MTAGIYLITNKINGHMYVGGSINIEKRLKEHKRGDDVDNQIIDRAILKYGVENFTYQIITELPANWDIIGEHERYWINFYNTFENKNHYNLTKGGGGISGWKHTEESRKKMSENHADFSGKNNPFYGQKHTPETCKKMSESHTGVSGENHPMWGKKHTPESRKKMSDAQKGEKNNNWKNYPRIVLDGKGRSGKQRYKIIYNGKVFTKSIYKEKLYKKWYTKYPNIELIDETE